MRLVYDEPAELTPTNDRYTEAWDGWHSSLPLGNGYTGATVFGGTERERIQLTEKSFFASSTGYIDNRYSGGLENFAETYIEFGHAFDSVTDYTRELSLDDGVATVSYTYGGVTYTREIFASYPDRVIAVHLSASEAGGLSFTLAPEIPNLRTAEEAAESYGNASMAKTGTVSADAQSGTIVLSGTASYYNLNYEALYRLDTDGAVTAENPEGGFGSLSVAGASEATVYIALGTNYELAPKTFTSAREEKLDPTVFPHDTLAAILDGVYAMTYSAVRARHVADYVSLYGSVDIDLGGVETDMMTDDMLLAYKNGEFDNNYIYELYYQIGRYFEICCSRDGTLPSNLVGTWCVYQFAPWTGGNWYNINQQMNYWGVFAANLTEAFKSYLQFNDARMERAKANADAYVLACNPDNYTEPGTNGWLVGTGNNPYSVGSASPGGHSGVGTVGMTTIDYWNYYLFTMDGELLYDTIFTVLQESARFYTKFAVLDENGLYLCTPSASPEQLVNGKAYTTVGCAFDQQMMYENNFNYLEAVKAVRAYEEANGITESIIDETLLATVNEQITHYDPVIVGLSGQIKEYREEGLYGEIGDKSHRHISQLMGLANGTEINSNTPAWLDAARKTLTLRGSLSGDSTGWALAQRMFGYARSGDGESASILLDKLVSNHLYNNFWNNHGGVFQIDANFGAMAAISEMLLQSHEGYLNLLPAIPADFENGSFSGILARGNFTVDLAWEGGAPTVLTVTSNKGVDARIYYPSYGTVAVVDGNGSTVSYTIADGVISFPTEEGVTYTVTGFTPAKKAKTPASVTADSTDYNNVVLTWEASATENAVYNIYRAFESSPVYELIGTTDTLTFTDTEKGTAQATYSVKAYNDSTLESLGALVTVIETPDAPTGTEAREIEVGTLQLEWDAVEDCTYRIYSGDELIEETELLICVLPAGKEYTVSAVYYGMESERAAFTAYENDTYSKVTLFELYREAIAVSTYTFKVSTVATKITESLSGAVAVLNDKGAVSTDIEAACEELSDLIRNARYELHNLAPLSESVSVTPDPLNASYPVSAMLDGNTSTYYSSKRVGTTSTVVAEFTLGSIYSIDSIHIYEFADSGVARSETASIELFVGNEWITVLAPADTATLGTGSGSTFQSAVTVDSTLPVMKVRVTLDRQADNKKNINVKELQIWGSKFNTGSTFGNVVVNSEKPESFSYAIDNEFSVGDAVYTDRVSAANYMSAVHVGEELLGLSQIRLPLADSTRTSNTELREFIAADNTYFTFDTLSDGTVYVLFKQPLVNLTEERGWRLVAEGVKPTLPSGEALTTLAHDYVPEDAPYYLTRLQYNKNTGAVSGAIAYTYCYALDYKAGDTVAIPTAAVGSADSPSVTNENLVVLIDSEPLAPELTALSINGTLVTPDEDGYLTAFVGQDIESVTLKAYLKSDEWTVSYDPDSAFALSSDFTSVTVSVGNGTVTRTYTLRIIRKGTSVLEGLTPSFESTHTSGNVNSGYPLSNMTDGDLSTRMAAYDTAVLLGDMKLVYTLDGNYTIDSISLYVWADKLTVTDETTGVSTSSYVSRVGAVTVEGYVNGEWVTLASFDMGVDSTLVENGKVMYTAELSSEAQVSMLRLTLSQNPDGRQKGISVFEFGVEGSYVVPAAPALESVSVNGAAATIEGEKIYAYVESTVTEITVQAIANDPASTVSYEPSNVLSYNGNKLLATVKVTNPFGESKSYTLIIQNQPTKTNVLLGLTPSFVVGSSGQIYEAYPISLMTDGDSSSRMAAYDSAADLEFEYTLDGQYTLTGASFCVFADSGVSRTGEVIVRGLIGGEWVDLITTDLSTVSGSGVTVSHTVSFDAEAVEAIRIYLGKNAAATKAQSIYELAVTGYVKADTSEEESIDSFQILSNVTLDSDFDFHLYVPYLSSVLSISLGGEEKVLNELPVAVIDGASYYKLTIPTPAREAFVKSSLVVTLSIGEKTATGTWSVSLFNYLSGLLSKGSDVTENMLLKDILSYIHAAIAYFATVESGAIDSESEAALAKIDSVLARYAYTETVPEALSEEVVTPSSGTGVKSAAFSLDSTVSFVLTLETGYTAEDFTFLVGGEAAEVQLTEGYVLIRVAAYRIGDILTWSVQNKDDETETLTGEYSLTAYYQSDAIDDTEEGVLLKTLVERLSSFSSSAAVYKASKTSD